MAARRRRGVRIGTEYLASHFSIASNITIANSTTNPPAQRPRQPVNAGRIPRSIDNQYILTTVDGRLGYSIPSNNGCVCAPQGCVLPAWQTHVGQNNTLSIWFLLKQQLKSLLVLSLLLKNHTLIKHKFVLEACLSHI
ncbi:hypothetical protein C1H46_022636 [Malus baccata]|uniref:Uncharacterized protein n=1 Tax=Malus baccata TaxID=106549 RepID=A0A540LZ75_MALBA|nr:hypothetical protein C1H46_022636 [Malus baccata]